jgi:hypothetical protein
LLLHLHPTPGDEHPATTRALSTIVVGVFGTDENAREGYTERERIYRERIYRERIYRERIYRERIYRERIYTEREGHTHTQREREREKRREREEKRERKTKRNNQSIIVAPTPRPKAAFRPTKALFTRRRLISARQRRRPDTSLVESTTPATISALPRRFAKTHPHTSNMAYNGRRGPNVSEYIANLNAIPTAQDIQAANSELNFEDDLAMFTNTQFFDFDMGQDADLPANFGPEAATAPGPDTLDLGKSFDLIDGTLGVLCFCISFLSLSPSFHSSSFTRRRSLAVVHSPSPLGLCSGPDPARA